MTAYLIDTETTGLKDPELIEAAWISLSSPPTPEPITSFSQLYQPSKPIELGAMAVHHIHDVDLRGCPPSSEFALPEDAIYLIGHHVEFDWKVIGQPDVKLIDTRLLARVAWPGLDSYSQAALVYHLLGNGARESLIGSHRAKRDVLNCLIILQAVITRLRLADWHTLHIASEAARLARSSREAR